MREITYMDFDAYLVKADAHDDPKTIKIFANGIALTFLRTHLIQWKGELGKDVIEKLKEHGHCRAIIEDIAPLGRM